MSNHKISPHDLIGCSFFGYHIEVLFEHNDVTGIFISQKEGKYYIIKAALARNAASLIEREESIIRNVVHRGVVSLIARIDIHGLPALVLHRYSRGSLTQYMGLLSVQEISNIFSHLCEICDFLFAHRIFHRDIKPDNIVFDDTGIPVLIDFGMSCFTDEQAEYFTGTLEYAAPEVLREQKVSHESELYSVAAVVYALLHGNPPSKDSVLRTQHGLSVQEDAKLNRMLNRELHPKIEKKSEEKPQQVPNKREPENNTRSSLFVWLSLIFLLLSSITILVCI